MFPTFAIPAEARLGGHIFSPARGFVFLRRDLIIIVGEPRHIQIKKRYLPEFEGSRIHNLI
jgi:hypothetical protein